MVCGVCVEGLWFADPGLGERRDEAQNVCTRINLVRVRVLSTLILRVFWWIVDGNKGEGRKLEEMWRGRGGDQDSVSNLGG